MGNTYIVKLYIVQPFSPNLYLRLREVLSLVTRNYSLLNWSWKNGDIGFLGQQRIQTIRF